MIITSSEIIKMESRYRANLFNTLSGYKSANLIGTISEDNITNLAIFNSVIHLGAHPPLMGFILRPTTVERHTYDNIKTAGYYTFNHVNENIIEKAHQTSAKYDRQISEFKACGLTEEFNQNFKAPFVAESIIKIGLKFKEEILIPSNNTILMVGEIQLVQIEEELIEEDGSIDLSKAKTITISGLDTYLRAEKLIKLSYARP